MPSLRSWPLRGCLLLALMGLVVACGGGGGDDNDGAAEQARNACRRLGDALVDANRVAEGGATQDEARRVVDELRDLADEADGAAEEDSAFFALANALNQLIAGLERANQPQIASSTSTAARQCLELFPDLTTTTTAATTTTTAVPTTSGGTEP